MADSKDDFRHATEGDVTSILGRRDRTRGDLHVSGGLRVDGVVRGNIEPGGNDAAVLVSPGGHVEGRIRAQRVRVEGHVTGAMIIEGHVDVMARAVIEGDISYGSMSIAPGAVVNGRVRCNIERDPQVEPTPRPVRPVSAAAAE